MLNTFCNRLSNMSSQVLGEYWKAMIKRSCLRGTVLQGEDNRFTISLMPCAFENK